MSDNFHTRTKRVAHIAVINSISVWGPDCGPSRREAIGAVPLNRLRQSGQSASPSRGKKVLSKTRWTKSNLDAKVY